jgi:hypothetical protein
VVAGLVQFARGLRPRSFFNETQGKCNFKYVSSLAEYRNCSTILFWVSKIEFELELSIGKRKSQADLYVSSDKGFLLPLYKDI